MSNTNKFIKLKIFKGIFTKKSKTGFNFTFKLTGWNKPSTASKIFHIKLISLLKYKICVIQKKTFLLFCMNSEL